MQKQDVILVKASRQLRLDHALFNQGANDPDAYWSDDVYIPMGTVGIVEGQSTQGEGYRTVTFERPFSKGFVTSDTVPIKYLLET